jgi:hypothetical protein
VDSDQLSESLWLRGTKDFPQSLVMVDMAPNGFDPDGQVNVCYDEFRVVDSRAVKFLLPDDQ